MLTTKKIISFLIFSVFMATSICFADPDTGDISEKEIALGGITLGATEDYVKKIYGEPTNVNYDYGAFEHSKTFDYGGTFKVKFGNGKVTSVETTANNGIKTPSGFSVGSRLSDIINYYNRVGTPSSNGAVGGRSADMIRYDHKWYMNLVFHTNSNGQVTKIRILSMP